MPSLVPTETIRLALYLKLHKGGKAFLIVLRLTYEVCPLLQSGSFSSDGPGLHAETHSSW